MKFMNDPRSPSQMHMEWTKSIQINNFFGYLDVLNVNTIVGRRKELEFLTPTNEVDIQDVQVSKERVDLY